MTEHTLAAWNHGQVSDPIAVDLDEDERAILRARLLDWGGPARPTDALALAMGFSNAELLSREAWALWKGIEEASALTAEDWRRALLAVEIVFASDVVGSGLDWRYTSGFSDGRTIEVLRGLQRKLPRWRSSAQFTVDYQGGVEVLDPERRRP